MNDQVLAVPGTGTGEDSALMNLEQNIDVIIQQAEKRVDTLKKVLGIAMKRLSHYDILDQSGKPYVCSTACQKLMPVFGINSKCIAYEKRVDTDDAGLYYIYVYKGTFYWAGGSIEAIGTCSSRDKFFAWDSANKAWKALSLVDEASVMKAAYSNMEVNGVSRLLGLKNLTWDQLTEFGFAKDKVQKVEYASGGAGGGLISEAQQKRLYAISKGAKKTDEQMKAIMAEYGYASSKEIKKEHYEDICKRAEEVIEM